MIKRIAITGPESTGKSMLAEALAGYFHTHWVKEYAREYLDGLGRHYNENDLLNIAKGQFKSETDSLRDARDFLFIDTDFLVLYIWSMDKFNRCHPWIEDKLASHKYDLYLLCDIDIPWRPDPMREDPDRRDYFFEWYARELRERKLSFAVIRGEGEDRLRNAVLAIRHRLG